MSESAPRVITAIKRQQRNPDRVNVFLDGEYAFAMSIEDVQSEQLRIGEALSPADIERLRAGDLVSKATESALRLLGVRPRSEHELRDRLRRKEYDEETIERVIARIRNWGYLDDADFARRWVENRLESRPRGKRMLVAELRQKGVDREAIETAIDESSIDEVAQATELARRAFAKMSGLDPAVARRRVMGQLARRGYGFDVIRTALGNALDGEDLDDL